MYLTLHVVMQAVRIAPLVVLYIPLSFPFTLPLAIVTVPVDTLFIPEPLVEIIAPPVEVSFNAFNAFSSLNVSRYSSYLLSSNSNLFSFIFI